MSTSKLNWAGLAILAAATATITILAATFLPFFMDEVWGPLWGAEWWEAGAVRSMGRVAPLCGLSTWPERLAVPLSSALVMAWFVIVIGLVVVAWSQANPQRR